MAKTKKASNAPYLIALGLLFFYNFILTIIALRQHDGMVLLFYSLVPDMFGVYLALYGFHQGRFYQDHIENHMVAQQHDTSQIKEDVHAVRKYVAIIAGVNENEEFNF